jgi:predicted anti-sigma-YlaC factor YlaD
MIPNCKHTAELLSQGQDRSLTLPEKFRLELHLLICDRCRNFNRQLAFMRTALRRYRDRD